jgi:hypothetical protein
MDMCCALDIEPIATERSKKDLDRMKSELSSIGNLILILLAIQSVSFGQTIGSHLPTEINKSGKYLFYQHGGVVTVLGDNAINQSVPEWGPYEYSHILDSLRKRGFHVISEIRKEDIDDSVYTNKIASQIDTLLRAGAKTKNILIVGASAGWNITLHVSAKLKNKQMKFVVMGGCWPNTYKDYGSIPITGKFLSIIERTDPHGTCNSIFQGRKKITSYQEIKLNTGLSHGLIYKGYKEWIDPLVAWSNR